MSRVTSAVLPGAQGRQDGPIRRDRQSLQRRFLLGEGFVDNALGSCVNPWVGDRVEPMAELRVEIIEVAERAAEEEVLADEAERPLHFPLRFGPIGSTGARLEP